MYLHITASFCILLVVFILISRDLQSKRETRASQLVPMPMVGGMVSSSDEWSDTDAITNQRTEWPSCVGLLGTECKTIILQEGSSVEPLNIYILDQYSMVTEDYRTNRVRIFIDDNGVVVRSPMIG